MSSAFKLLKTEVVFLLWRRASAHPTRSWPKTYLRVHSGKMGRSQNTLRDRDLYSKHMWPFYTLPGSSINLNKMNNDWSPEYISKELEPQRSGIKICFPNQTKTTSLPALWWMFKSRLSRVLPLELEPIVQVQFAPTHHYQCDTDLLPRQFQTALTHELQASDIAANRYIGSFRGSWTMFQGASNYTNLFPLGTFLHLAVTSSDFFRSSIFATLKALRNSLHLELQSQAPVKSGLVEKIPRTFFVRPGLPSGLVGIPTAH